MNFRANKTVNHPRERMAYERIFIILTILIIVLPSYFRGLFFEKEQMITHIISAVLLIFYFVLNNRQKDKLQITVLDISVGIYLIIYFISIFISVNLWLGIVEFLNVMNLGIIYYLVSRLNKQGIYTDEILRWMYWGCVGIAVIGILAAMGLPIYHSAYTGSRISSTFQYPNVLASFVTGFLLYGLYQITQTKASNELLKFSVGNILLSIAFIGTQSRGGFLVALAVIPIFVLMQKEKIKAILITLINFTLAVPAATIIVYLSTIEKGYLGSVIILLTMVMGWYITRYIIYNEINKKVLMAVPLLVIIIVSGMIFTGKTNIIDRLMNISLSDTDVVARLVYYQDAVKMIKERPILGYGGGGWQSAYKAFRSLPYFSTETHNHYLQTAVETGLLGLMAFLSIFLIAMTRLKELTSDRLYMVTAAITTVLFLHGFVDFNYSLLGYAITFFALIALMNHKIGVVEFSLSRNIYRILAVIILLIYFLTSCSISLSDFILEKAKKENKEGNIEKVISLYQDALKLNPINPSVYSEFGKVNYAMYQHSKDKKYLTEAQKSVDKAISIEPYKGDWYSGRAFYLVLDGNYGKESYEAIIKSIELDPYGTARYVDAFRLLINMTRASIVYEGNPQQARMYLDEMLKLWDKASLISESTGNYKWLIPKPNEASEVLQYTAAAYILQNDFEKGKVLWEKAKENTAPENMLKWPEVILYDKKEALNEKDMRTQVEEIQLIIQALKR